MDIEAGLISKIKEKEDLFLVIDEQITLSFFQKYADVYSSILKHYKHYHTIPGQEEIKEVFPAFEFEDSEQPIQYFVDSLKQRRKKTILSESISKVVPLIGSKQVDDAEKLLRKALSEIKKEIKTSTDIDMRKNQDTRLAKYFKLKEMAGIDGITCGWEGLDDLMLGYHPGELIVYIAEPKKGKTWLLTWQAHHIWTEEIVPVMFLTREMSTDSIQNRFDAIACKFPYTQFRRHLLTKNEEERYLEHSEKMKTAAFPFILLGYSMEDNSASVSSLIPKIEEHLIDGGVLFIDGIYLMEDDNGESDWKGLVNIAKDLKNLAQAYKIPIIATTQAKIEGKSYVPQMDNIAYAKYVAQYVDALLSIAQSKADKDAALAKIYLLAQREGDVGEFPIRFQFDPFIDFSQQAKVVRYDNEGEKIDVGL